MTESNFIPMTELTWCPVCQAKRLLIATFEEGLRDPDGELIALEFDCLHSTMIHLDRYKELTS